MVSQLTAALRTALPNADVRLLDLAPAPGQRNTPTAQSTLATARLLISTAGSETDCEAVLGELIRNPVLNVDGQNVRLIVMPASLEEKARLWLALGLPFTPSVIVEAGPVEI